MPTTLFDSGDLLAITQLQHGWGLWRDTCDWERLSGSLQHAISAPVVQGLGERAVAVTRVVLMVRGEFGGVPVDATCWGRFHDRLVKQDGAWRIQRRTPVYDKDRLDPVNAGERLALDADELARFPAHYRHLACMQSRSGATITMNLPAPLSEADRQLMQDDLQWLQAAG